MMKRNLTLSSLTQKVLKPFAVLASMLLVFPLTTGAVFGSQTGESLYMTLDGVTEMVCADAHWGSRKQVALKELDLIEEAAKDDFMTRQNELKALEEAKKEQEQAATIAAQAAPTAQNPVIEEAAQTSVSTPAAQSEAAPQAAPAVDPVWHVAYVNCFGAGSAPADGSVGQWAEGWFIAHNYMPSGQMISSMPEFVEIDGRVYQFAYSWTADDSITEAEIAQIRANGGITFQTCITDSLNLMVHYNPTDAAYPYSFTNYPFCATDGAALGYYPEEYE